MFFSISREHQENFPNQYQMGPLVVNTDSGWAHSQVGSATVVYKGYADEFDLSQNLHNILLQPQPCYTGNFCVFVYQNNCLEIKTDRYRSFPIYIGDTINNLVPGGRTVWADGMITVHNDLAVTENQFDAIGEVETSELTKQQVLLAIVDLLDKKTQAFLDHNKLPVNVYLTGGVDTLLVYSFLQKYTDCYDIVDYLHIDYDYFWLKNSTDIKSHWAYKQIHHWKTPCVLTSGTPGDEFMLRAPATGNMLLMHHNVNIVDLLVKQDYMQTQYFLKDKNTTIFHNMAQDAALGRLTKDKNLLFRELCNMNLNDWQHWHIGNTLTWTPLRDLEIFKLFLRLPVEHVVDQLLGSKISLDIIEHNCPGLSRSVSRQKNSNNSMSNLVGILNQVVDH